MIRLDLTTKGDTTVISDAGYILTWVYTPTENGKRRFYILPCAAYENRPEFFQSSSHYDDMMIFIKDARRLLDNLNTGISEMTFAEGKWTRVIRQNVSIN